MTRTVAIVCGAGVSSTFLARAVRDLVRERDLDWSVEALAEDQLVGRAASLDLVLLGQHVASRLDLVRSAMGDVPIGVLAHTDHLTAARDAVALLTSTIEREGLTHG
jgi:PTS system cellobiose-specific IIB component